MVKLYLMLGFRDKTHFFKYFDEDMEDPLMKIVRSDDEIKKLAVNYNCEIWIKYELKEGKRYLVEMIPEED